MPKLARQIVRLHDDGFPFVEKYCNAVKSTSEAKRHARVQHKVLNAVACTIAAYMKEQQVRDTDDKISTKLTADAAINIQHYMAAQHMNLHLVGTDRQRDDR